ncbi:MAG: cytochrome C oxidase subunit IV [Dehalococcoidia bacterium]|nr:cytochrome C oxidase subunit IV [Dehalococcoidia bacterium]
MAHGNSPAAAHHSGERQHPTPATYAKIATTLVLITMLEVGIFYVQALHSVVIPIFFILSVIKFALVVMFYMHLRFDARLLAWVFVGGLVLALAVVTALIGLFHKGLLLRP